MRKGFAATPILFAAIFLIVGWLMIHYMDMDKFVANSIKEEGKIRKVQAATLKDVSMNKTSAFMAGIGCAQISQNSAQLKNCIQDILGITIKSIDNVDNGNQFRINFNSNIKESFEEVSVERTFGISETVDYPFQKLVDAGNNFIQNRGQCKPLDQMIQNNPWTNIIWNYDPPFYGQTSCGGCEDHDCCGSCCCGGCKDSPGCCCWDCCSKPCSKFKCNCYYYLILHNNSFSEKNTSIIYDHIVNKMVTISCYYYETGGCNNEATCSDCNCDQWL